MPSRLKSLLTAIVIILLGAPTAALAAQTHVVKKGETLGGIAAHYRCTVSTLKRGNRIRSDLIKVGQKLSIPKSCTPKLKRGRFPIVTHTVLKGETLGQIADRYGVTVDHLRSMNKRRVGRKGIIRVGQKLKVRPTKHVPVRRKVIYRIHAGDTLSRIAARHGISVKDIQRFNPKKNPNKLRIGERITLWLEGPEQRSAAVGKPQAGRLVDGEQLPKGPGWFRRRPHRSWGTNETIQALIESFTQVRKKHPKAHDIAVGDISDKDGGRLARHKSHQTGLDVDLGFYFKRQPRTGPKAFLNANKHYLDYDANWTLINALNGSSASRNNRVAYMFIDYTVQRKLYNWAKKRGVSKRTLSSLFQYPRGKRSMTGIIRHEPGHANHIHVRFKCPRGDAECI